MLASIHNVIAGIFQPYDYESITVADTAIGFTAAKIAEKATIIQNSDRGPTRCVVTVETAQLRYRYDGSDPTSAEGHILNINDVLVVVGPDAIKNFRGIRTGGTSAV